MDLQHVQNLQNIVFSMTIKRLEKFLQLQLETKYFIKYTSEYINIFKIKVFLINSHITISETTLS